MDRSSILRASTRRATIEFFLLRERLVVRFKGVLA